MKKIYLVLASLLCLESASTTAQFKTLLTFTGTNGEEALYSTPTIIGGTLYGVATYGGAYDSGTIFSIDTNGTGYTDLHDFHLNKGNYPVGALISVGNKLFGVTALGGAHDSGSIFSIYTDGSGFKDIYDFTGGSAGGVEPINSLVFSGGLLYGTTVEGGALNLGIIYSVDTDGTNFQDIHDFIGTKGEEPYCALTIYKDKMYGTTPFGGANDSGCVFSMHLDGSAFADILDFTGTNGSVPAGGVIYSGGSLFGTTYVGGGLHLGCIYSVDTDGTGYSDMHDFNTATGGNSYSTLALSAGGGLLFGATATGGVNDSGSIFSIKTDGGSYKDLYDFNHLGYQPELNSLVLSGDDIYGMLPAGGADGLGVVYSFKDITLSVDNVKLQQGSIAAYPNPNNGMFTIKSSVTGGLSNVLIYNMLGEQVYSQYTTFSTPLSVNLSNQANGIYLYRVISENGEMVGEGKLDIQK